MKGSEKILKTTTSSVAPSDEGSPSLPRRFALTGPTVCVDPAVNAYRDDVADIALAGQVIASHYAEPLMRRCAIASALLADGNPAASSLGDLKVGEAFAVLDCTRGYAWGYRVGDHRVGYVDQTMLVPAD